MFTLSIILLVVALIAIGTSFFIRPSDEFEAEAAQSVRKYVRIGGGVATGLSVLCFVFSMVITVPAGHAAVGTLFGEVYKEAKYEGLHFVNPLSKWTEFDCRQKTLKESAKVPSADQLLTGMEISIQYRGLRAKTPSILKETGNLDAAVEVHLVPYMRSKLRELGKTVDNAEGWYQNEVQERVQKGLETALQSKMAEKGIQVQQVLIRDITLPPTIAQGIKEKKLREQEAEKEKAELRRFETEQQKKVKTAEAEKRAAEMEAAKVKVLADAKAYEIKKINQAISQNPAYIKLEALKALQSISKDPNAKLYFLNGDSPQPLPLMNIGK
jgi:regulator of protease activity HflC (stomatin/prohibitin superfamily)